MRPAPESAIQVYQAPEKMTSIAMSQKFLIAGTTDGMLHLFDSAGTLKKRFAIGEESVSPVLLDHTLLKAACSGNVVTLFEHDAITASVDLAERRVSLAAYASCVLAWAGQTAWLIGPRGHVLWRAEFARRIGDAVCDSTSFHLLSGEIYSFRSIPESRRATGASG